jgi:hypothetical protein
LVSEGNEALFHLRLKRLLALFDIATLLRGGLKNMKKLKLKLKTETPPRAP